MTEQARRRPRRRRAPRDAQATMTLIAHLTELRNRIAKALLALLIATAVAFWWYEHGLGEFIRAPYCDLPAHLRYGGGYHHAPARQSHHQIGMYSLFLEVLSQPLSRLFS